jgi:hypothetical protein
MAASTRPQEHAMTTPTNRVRQLIRRTKHNLDAIDKLHSNGDKAVYEVTQIVNSCLAMIVHLCEEAKDSKKPEDPKKPEDSKNSISSLLAKNDFQLQSKPEISWPNLTPTDDSLVTPLRWTEQLRLLRNGIAHGNIKFHPERSGKEITHIEIWNKLNGDKGKKTWGTKISVADMRKMIEFIDTTFGQDG